MRTKHFIIDNQIDKLTFLAEKIEELAKEWNLPMELAMNINLVIEEAVSNIIFYAFTDKKKHEIKISISLNNKQLTIEIIDDGKAFNPMAQQQPNITLPVEERPVGGLGIYLITQIMDNTAYKRKENKNILILNKNI